jgi:hypothetical protein
LLSRNTLSRAFAGACKKPGFPLQVLGIAHAIPVGFPLQSLARPISLRLQGFDSRDFAPKKKLHPEF